jgi:hypothetical protein
MITCFGATWHGTHRLQAARIAWRPGTAGLAPRVADGGQGETSADGDRDGADANADVEGVDGGDLDSAGDRDAGRGGRRWLAAARVPG